MLENTGFIDQNGVNDNAAFRAKRTKIVDLALDSSALTAASQIERSGSIFAHTASLALSGHPSPCAGLECRLKAANDLAQFAAFYSEKVFINNGLRSVANGHGHKDLEVLRHAFRDELEVLLTLRPLIDSGIVVPVTLTDDPVCFHCLGKSVLESSDTKKFDRAMQMLAKRYQAEVSIAIECDEEDDIYLHIKGDEDLVEHGSLTLHFGKIDDIEGISPRLVSQLKRNGFAELPGTLRTKMRVDKRLAHEAFNDIGLEMAVSQSLGSSVVTNHPIDVEVLKEFIQTNELNRRNSIIEQHLTCMVPYLNSVSVAELLELRNAENDAFVSFRHVFAKAMDDQIKNSGDAFTESDAEKIYRDIIQPELARLNRKTKAAGNAMFRKSRANVVGWSAAITAGMYFGFVESSIIAAANALGLTKVVSDLASSLLASSKEDPIREENFFFLWKVAQHRR